MPTRIAGAVLVVLGFIGLAAGGIPYGSTKQVAEFGDLRMSVREEKSFKVPPVVSGLAILLGAVLLVTGGKKPNL